MVTPEELHKLAEDNTRVRVATRKRKQLNEAVEYTLKTAKQLVLKGEDIDKMELPYYQGVSVMDLHNELDRLGYRVSIKFIDDEAGGPDQLYLHFKLN